MPVRAGFGRKILLSHDVCLHEHLGVAGGCGYAYLLAEFLPHLTAAGLDEEQVRTFVTDNPVAALTGGRLPELTGDPVGSDQGAVGGCTGR